MGPLGLSVSWRGSVAPNQVVRNCRISHRLGHFEESGDLAMPVDQGKADGMGASPAQRVGIADSYAKRYSLIAVAVLSPEEGEDTDAAKQPQEGVQQPRRREDPTPQTVEHEPVAKLPELEPGLVVELHGQVAKIEKVVGGDPKKPWTLFNVWTTNGDKVSTFDTKLAEVAESFRQTSEAVSMSCRATPKGWNFTGIEAAEQPPE